MAKKSEKDDARLGVHFRGAVIGGSAVAVLFLAVQSVALSGGIGATIDKLGGIVDRGKKGVEAISEAPAPTTTLAPAPVAEQIAVVTP